MEGIDPAFLQEIEHALGEFVTGLASGLVSSTSATGRRESTLRKQVDQAGAVPAKQFYERLDSYSGRSHVRPVVSPWPTSPRRSWLAWQNRWSASHRSNAGSHTIRRP